MNSLGRFRVCRTQQFQIPLCCKGAVTIAILVVASVAHGQLIPIETLTIPTTGEVISSQSLIAGAPYILQASGTAYYSTVTGSLLDARSHSFGGGPYELLPDSRPSDLWVNGISPSWLGTTDGLSFSPDVLSPSHIYRLDWTGTGDPLQIFLQDSFYADNAGSLRVEIFAVPEPAVVPLLGISALALTVLRLRRIKVAAR